MQQTSSKREQDLTRLGGKEIHWELCKRFKFDHTAKWYVHESDFVLENKMQKILDNFEE